MTTLSKAEQVLEALIHAASDSASNVRSAASAALGELVKAAPAKAEQVLEALIHAASDSASNVRSAASAALGELVKADPAKAEPVLEALIHAARDSYRNVRRAASAALGELVKADPAKAEPVLEALIHAARDSDRNVRRAASAALGELVKAAPHLMNEAVLTALVVAARDSDVRRAAIAALSELAKAAPSEAVLKALFAAARDNHYDVRRAASEALDSISSQQLIQAWIHSQNQKIISLIVRRLYATPLVVQESRQPGYQQLVLYPSAGQPEVVGKWPQAEITAFVEDVQAYHRSLLVAALVHAPIEEALPRLLAALEDQPLVRSAALATLGQLSLNATRETQAQVGQAVAAGANEALRDLL